MRIQPWDNDKVHADRVSHDGERIARKLFLNWGRVRLMMIHFRNGQSRSGELFRGGNEGGESVILQANLYSDECDGQSQGYIH